jgi:hypothetical protein
MLGLARPAFGPSQNKREEDEGRADGSSDEDDMSGHCVLPLDREIRSAKTRCRSLIQINYQECAAQGVVVQ